MRIESKSRGKERRKAGGLTDRHYKLPLKFNIKPGLSPIKANLTKTRQVVVIRHPMTAGVDFVSTQMKKKLKLMKM